MVRLYSCDPAVRDVLVELAAEYTALTAVEVVILAEEADGCEATLRRLMESEEPPTTFCIHSNSQLQNWQSVLLDLNDAMLTDLLRNEDLGLWLEGRCLAIPVGLQAYGLLFNAELLGVALTRSDITDFASLGTAVQILKDNSLKAFPTFAPTAVDAWHLLSVKEAEQAREYLDLYLSNCNTTGDALTQFLDGKAVFLPGGSWEYEALAAYTDRTFHVRNLDILPTYIGGAMQYVCDTAWGVNADARQEDIDATLTFLYWLGTAGEDTPAPIDRLQMLTPFADGAWYGNQLEKKLLGYMSDEPAVMDFNDALLENDALLTALNAYLQSPTDENWEQLLLCMEQLRTQPIPQ